MTERELAANVARCHGRSIVDDLHGITIGGATFGEEYAKKLYRAGGYDVNEVSKIEFACRHWVMALGYNEIGQFQVIMANSIQNC